MLVTGARVFVRLLSLINLVVLARLLTPHDYGIVALALSTAALLFTISDVRVAHALIGMRDVTDAHLHTAFTLGLLRGLLVAAALIVGAQPAAAFMDQPALGPVLMVLALSSIADGLRNPAFILFRRNLELSQETTRQVVSTIAGGLATIAAAFALRSYWAIVIGSVTLRVVEVALTYWRVAYRPRLGLAHWRGFVGFGGWLTLTGLCDYITTTAPQFVIGKAVGAGLLGQYTVARELSNIATREIVAPLSIVVFPGFAAVAHDPDRLRRAYRQVQATMLGLAIPIGFGTAMLAREIVLLLAGPQWIDAIFAVQILAPTAAIALLNTGTSSLAMTKSRTQSLFWRSLVMALISYPVLLVGIWLDGFEGAIYAISLRALFATAYTSWFGSRLADDNPMAALLAGWRSIVSGAAMCFVLALLPRGEIADPGNVGALLLHTLPLVAAGAFVYIATHAALWLSTGRPSGIEQRVLEAISMARPRPRTQDL